MPQFGCKRAYYLRTADRDAYTAIAQKGAGPTYRVEPSFSVLPDNRSRFADPTCATDPTLPVAAPQLYRYTTPELATPPAAPRDLSRPDQPDLYSDGRQSGNRTGATTAKANLPWQTSAPSPANQPVSSDSAQPLAVVPAAAALASTASESVIRGPSLDDSAIVVPAPPIQERVVELAKPQDSEPRSIDAAQSGDLPEQLPAPAPEAEESAYEIRINPVPVAAWQSLPAACLQRMLEFESVREEYRNSFNTEVTEAQLDDAQRVNLANILELALINSREYQSRKESLYRVALRLSLERFQYDLRFRRRGNGIDVRYDSNRVGGIEVNRLRTPVGFGLSKSLYSAGELAVNFANDVVLTFGGASGYTPRVGSEILVDLSQPILQRDVRFEPLTQSERDVVYAAREYVRYRKQLFRDLARQYYNLLLTYRSIAIDTQDYFSNLRGFNRAAALERVGEIPRYQVDQFEQNALRSRGSLIDSCNTLEGALDRLKLVVGLPTEMPLNVDLSELEDLTLRDEATVIQEQIRRKLAYVGQQRERVGAESAITAAAEAARRMMNLVLVKEQLQQRQSPRSQSEPENQAGPTRLSEDKQSLQRLITRLEVEGMRIDARKSQKQLNDLPVDQNQPAQVFFRTSDVVDGSLSALARSIDLLDLIQADNRPAANSDPLSDNSRTSRRSVALDRLDSQLVELTRAFDQIQQRHEQIDSYEQRTQFYPTANEQLQALMPAVTQLDRTLTEELRTNGVRLANSDAELDEITAVVQQWGDNAELLDQRGLVPIEVDVDEAMLTALVQRLDLMNVRGELADAWRDIKYAGDDLRSILNIRATHGIRTRLGKNSPFDFTFDDSSTALALELDTPLNRRVERNVFRLALINYNAALRNLIEAEDNIKLQIRDDLRSLELDRNQYEISIASAALAYERVVSTRLQLITPGGGNITARDFLEAQQAFTASLSAVARQHIGYLVDRIDFFLDLEQLQVDQVGFWPDLRNEEYTFLPNMDFAGTTVHAYGELSCGPWYTKCLRRMEQVPNGTAMSHRVETEDRPQPMVTELSDPPPAQPE